MNVFRPLVVAAAISIVLAGCGDRQTTAPAADAEATAIPQPNPRVAYLVALSGDVQVQDTTGLGQAEPGGRIDDGRLVVVPAGAQSDIQFGEQALVRLYGPAQAVVRSRAGLTSRPVMEIELQSGSLAATVNELSGADVFRVRSRRALYDVRGTTFYLRTDEADLLVVEEGVLAVLPRSLDVPALVSSVGNDEAVREALFAMAEAASTVAAGRRVQVTTDAVEASEHLAGEVDRAARSLQDASDQERGSLVEQLLEAIRATADSLPRIGLSGAPTDEDVAAKLEAMRLAVLLPTSKDPQNLSLLDDPDTTVVKFTLRTVPQNSRIYIRGDYVGESVYRGLFRANESLSIRVAKPGYRERRIQIDRARTEVVTVQLDRLPPSISAESFLQAIRADDLGTVRTYIQEGGSPDVRTDDGVPAVVFATGIVPALSGRVPDLSYHREIVRTIVTAGADLNLNFVIEGATFKLLHAVVLAGMAGFDVPGLVGLLVTNGADVNAIIVLDGEELTPLAIAVRWALFTGETEEEIVRILLEGGASLDVAISFDEQLLTLREIATQLIEQGEIDDPQLIRLLRQAGAGA